MRHVELGGNRLNWTQLDTDALSTHIETFGVHYNLLQVQDTQTTYFLDAKNANPNWRFTQTLPPLGLRTIAVYTHGVQLSWTPIFYTADSGGYEISYPDNIDGPYTVFTETANKSVDSFDTRGLPAGAHYIRLRTHSIVSLDASNPSNLTHYWSGYTWYISSFTCTDITEIPQSECLALLAIYNAANGPYWAEPVPQESTVPWFTTATPCTNWKGLVCTDGHIRGIDLTGFHLRGALPPEIDDLTYLESLHLGYALVFGPHDISEYSLNYLASIPPEIGNLVNLSWLDLGGNQLTGLPAGIGNLTNLSRLELHGNMLQSLPAGFENLANLSYLTLDANGLQIDDPALRSFLDQKSPLWNTTQTIPPSDFHGTVISGDEIALGWTPIVYTAHGGGYEISHAASPSGPFTVLGLTADKTAGSFLASGLPESAAGDSAHYFRLRTHTPPYYTYHTYDPINPNDLWSSYTSLDAVTFDCSTVSEMPQSECAALVSLYNATHGTRWTENSGWMER